ncbi:MAG: hypothetical protein ABFS02_06720 [Pseudomonadota bacterium]
MATILFILTLIFIAYFAYIMISDSSGGASTKEVRAPEATEKPVAAKAVASRAEAKTPEATKQPAAAKREEVPRPKEKAEETAGSGEKQEPPTGLRNPGTGEVATVPSNYRFAKRWIKEAMVSEGLLDRIYKNNELSGENGDKVKQALESFKALKKYHA